jgi:hypothetical protein
LKFLVDAKPTFFHLRKNSKKYFVFFGKIYCVYFGKIQKIYFVFFEKFKKFFQFVFFWKNSKKYLSDADDKLFWKKKIKLITVKFFESANFFIVRKNPSYMAKWKKNKFDW